MAEPQLARDVAEQLGAGWSAVEDPNAYPRDTGAFLVGPDGERLRFTVGGQDAFRASERGRVAVHCDYPEDLREFVYPWVHRMTASASKAPSVLAKDIRRHILPAYSEAVTAARQRRDHEQGREAERLAILDDVAAVLAPLGESYRQPGRVVAGRYGDPVEVDVTADLAWAPETGLPTNAKASVRVPRWMLGALARAIAEVAAAGVPRPAAEPYCNHDALALHEMLMDLCECGTVLHEGEEYVHGPAEVPDGLWVWSVQRLDQSDGFYLFASEERARQYAGHYGDEAVVNHEVVMNDSAAGQFIIDSAGDE